MTRQRRILVVDDDTAMVRTIADVLRLREWEVATAHSGEEALAEIDARPFAVVLMDIKMKGISGVEALRRIRSKHPGTRVILMTAYTTNELIEEARAEDAAEILSKPLAFPQLLTLLEEQAEVREPVLVVDDDPDFLRGLCDGLEEHGVPTRRALDLREALTLLEEQGDIRVVLLDLKLNGFLGPKSVLAIRDVRPQVLVILFSGYHATLQEVMADLPEGAVVTSLTKPFDPDQLLRILDGLHAT